MILKEWSQNYKTKIILDFDQENSYIISMKNKLHRLHLIADAIIGGLALISLFLPDTWMVFLKLDVVFHITIFVLAFSVIFSEKIFHRGKHQGIISD